jgi:hypothetical protein
VDKSRFIWDVWGTRCIKLAQIKEFTIQRYEPYGVLAWLNTNDYLTIHQAESKEKAVDWLNSLINQM